MKKKIVSALLTATMVCGMSVVPAVGVAAADDTITVGFSQVGAESDWRTANTESMKSTFSEENGYELIFDDAQQKQENQLTAIRNFIQQEVDYILLAPVTETGWDTVLQEAKDADIPVIIVDRMVDVSDDSLYTTWIGTDSLLEGRKAAEWLNAYTTAKGIDAKDVNIVDIRVQSDLQLRLDVLKALKKVLTTMDGTYLLSSPVNSHRLKDRKLWSPC